MQETLVGGWTTGILERMVELSSDLGDPILQSAVLYFGLGDLHLDRQFFSVLAMMITSVIEELI